MKNLRHERHFLYVKFTTRKPFSLSRVHTKLAIFVACILPTISGAVFRYFNNDSALTVPTTD